LPRRAASTSAFTRSTKCGQAEALLKSDSHDYISDELQQLKSRLSGAGSVDALLQQWSQGAAGGKTFQQITEDFASIIIPKV